QASDPSALVTRRPKGPSPQPSPRKRGEGATTVRRRITALGQHIEERLQMALVMPPTFDRPTKDRLSNLPETGREDRAIGTMKIEASGLPVEPEEFDQTPALALGIGDQRLVVDGQHRQRQYSPPVLCQPLDPKIPPRAIDEIIGERISFSEPLKITGQAIITH